MLHKEMHQIVRVEFPLSKQLYKWILSKGNRRSRNDWNYRERNSQWPISCPLKLDNQWPGDFAHRNTYFWSINSQGKLISISFFFFFFLTSNLTFRPHGGTCGKWQPTPVFLSGKILWTEETGRLQSMGWQRVGHDWTTKTTATILVKLVEC